MIAQVPPIIVGPWLTPAVMTSTPMGLMVRPSAGRRTGMYTRVTSAGTNTLA